MAAQDAEEPAARWVNFEASGWVRWREVWEGAAQPVSDRLVELAGLAAGHSVLDLATGLGEPALTAAQRVGRDGRVMATDFSPAMLHEAAVRAEAAGLTNIEFRVMDAETPDLDPATFDAILCRWGFMFVPDLEGSLRRLTALLKPGGRLAAATWGPSDEVPVIRTSAAVVTRVAPIPDPPAGALHAFRLSDRSILLGAMEQAGLAEVSCEEVSVAFEFASAEEYTQLRRDMTTLDAQLAERHPPDVVEAAWQAVTEAARAFDDGKGRLRFVNTVLCYSGRR